MNQSSKFSAVLICAVCLAGILPLGCPSSVGKSNVTVVLAGDAGFAAAKTRLDMESVESLTVTVTEIALEYCPALVAEGEGEGEGEVVEESDEEKCECAYECGEELQRIVVFEGEKTVNLRDLSGISEVISTAELPAGYYVKIWLSIKDPQLILTDDPDTVLTNVQLTANGRLFACAGFELLEGDNSLVMLDFESFHLVQAGNSGKYVLTPHLRVTVQVQDAAVFVTGAIVAVDPQASILTLDVANSDAAVDVDFSSAAVILADATPGTPADLVVGANVQVTGTLSVSGLISADTVTLMAP